MSISTWLEDLRTTGVDFWVDGAGLLRYRCAHGILSGELKDQLRSRKHEIIAHLRDAGTSAVPRLSNLQQAYWVGEQRIFRYPTRAHVHLVYETPGLTCSQLEHVLSHVMRRHPPLRCRITAEGQPELLAEPRVPLMEVQVTDDAQAFSCDSLKAHDVLPPAAIGPLFAAVLVRGPTSRALHLVLSLIAFDPPSVQILLHELQVACTTPRVADQWPTPAPEYAAHPAPPLCQPAPNILKKQAAERYWHDRLASLPPAPKLPLRTAEPTTRGEVKFVRHAGTLPAELWARLRASAKGAGVSINAVLLSVYIECLRRWSEVPDFTLNLMFSQRAAHTGQNAIIGNFSTTLLLVCTHQSGTFLERTRAVYARLLESVANSSYDGVALLRRLGTHRSLDPTQPLAPYVFSSQVDGFAKREQSATQWPLVNSAMATPQVWLDHQVFEADGGIGYNWDIVSGVFLPGVIEACFTYYETRLRDVAQHDALWESTEPPSLPESMLRSRHAANDTCRTIPPRQIHLGLWEHARSQPSRPLLISATGTISYQEAASHASSVAAKLRAHGVGPGARVLVHGRKDPNTIMAIFGTLAAGATYIPSSPKMPPARVLRIAAHANVSFAITDEPSLAASLQAAGTGVLPLDGIEPIERWETFATPLSSPEDPAYIMYTSGSTGEPKGVVISHRAAWNTIDDVCCRFQFTANDRLLAVSEFTFDLSVFDLFGAAACGAAIIVPTESAVVDPEVWVHAAQRFGATVWNSVPSIIELAVGVLKSRSAPVAPTLRLLMASGDWIPLSLPSRVKALLPDAQFISLGGATEASIWSNYYVVEQVDAGWRSIPYGYPLANQRFHVLDADLWHRPCHVPGHLFIAGDGLAEGYWSDAPKTDASFFTSSQVGERVYRTGDLARYGEDGCVEFLGRDDLQVKHNGFRIELGEIEAAIERDAAVRRAVVTMIGNGSNKTLVAAVHYRRAPDAETLLKNIAAELPAYMVPSRLIAMDPLPFNQNGKVDRKAVAQYLANELKHTPHIDAAPGMTAHECAIAQVWQSVLGHAIASPQANFFEVGGNSVLAVQLQHELNREFNLRVPLSQLYILPTLREQAALLFAGAGERVPALITLKAPARPTLQLYLLHPVGGSISAYRELTTLLPETLRVTAAQADLSHPVVTFDGLASFYADAIADDAGDGTLIVAGWSMGGMLALEVTRQLIERGRTVLHILAIDPWAAATSSRGPVGTMADEVLARAFLRDVTGHDAIDIASAPAAPREMFAWAQERGLLPGALGNDVWLERFHLFRRNYLALLAHSPVLPAIPTTLFRARSVASAFPGLMPLPAASDDHKHRSNLIELPGDHYSVMRGECVRRVAECIAQVLPGSVMPVDAP